MKLYYSPGACSMSSHLILQESGLKYSTVRVDLQKGHFEGGELEQVNPKGYVPVLELDNGEFLTEAAVIAQYLGDQAPQAGLIPKWGSMERYRCQEWLNFIATELHKGFGPLWDEDMPQKAKELATEYLGKRFEFLSKSLQGKSYLQGADYSVADAYLFTILNWSHFVKLDLSKWHGLLGYMETVRSRPATQQVLRAEGLLKKTS